MEDRKIIHDRILKNITDEYDKSEGSFIYDVTKPVAIEMEKQGSDIDKAINKLDVENLVGDELGQFIYQRTGIERKPATKATTIVTIQGQEGAKIFKGDLVGTDTVNFISTEDKSIGPTGKMDVIIECEVSGVIGNVPARTIRYFPVSIPGLITVTNYDAVTNGYNAESDNELRQRYYDKIRTPATSGNKYHYLNWAKEVTGVGDVRVIPLWDGDNTVKVIIIDSNKQPANGELVEKVQNHIDPKGEYIAEEDRWTTWGAGEGQAPIGAFCTVVSAIGKSINTEAVVQKDDNYDLEQIKNNIGKNITEYLKGIAFKNDDNNTPIPVSYAKAGANILESEGVLDYRNFKLNDGTANIPISVEEVAVLGEVVINE